MEPVTLDNILNIYAVRDGRDGGVHNQLLGRVVATPSRHVVLSDYTGALASLDGPVTADRLNKLENWKRSSHSRVVSLAALHAGYHPELMPEVRLPASIDPVEPSHDAWFRVERPDLEKPLVIGWKDGKATLHGQELSHQELAGIMSDVKSGKARIRHHRLAEDLLRAESSFQDLAKADPSLQAALEQVKAAVSAGHLHPDVEKALMREIYYDPMTPGIKNKKSFHEDIPDTNVPRNAGGVHVMLDGNDFGSINKIHGHHAGDHAIRAFGGAIRSAMDEAVGPDHQDLWRFGGDEFAAWLPSHEHAASFLRSVREKLEKLPAIGGTHTLSMSVGIGPTHAIADQALNQHAKAAKRAAAALPGSAKMHVHSLMPGYEGEVPVSPDIPKPPEPKPAPAAPATAA